MKYMPAVPKRTNSSRVVARMILLDVTANSAETVITRASPVKIIMFISISYLFSFMKSLSLSKTAFSKLLLNSIAFLGHAFTHN